MVGAFPLNYLSLSPLSKFKTWFITGHAENNGMSLVEGSEVPKSQINSLQGDFYVLVRYDPIERR